MSLPLTTDIAQRLRRQAAELLAVAEALEAGHATDVVHAPPIGEKMVETSQAEKIIGMSRSWLYANAQKFGFGMQLPTGAWRFYEQRLRDFAAGKSEQCAENAIRANRAAESDDAIEKIHQDSDEVIHDQ